MLPARATALIKYQAIVHRAFWGYEGPAWATYDEHFRHRAAHDPSLNWRIPQWALWVQIVVPSKPAWGERSDIIARNTAGTGRATGGMPGVQSPRTCYVFNASGKHSKANCGFAHSCGVCGAKNGAVTCPTVNPSRQSGHFVGAGGHKGGPANPAPSPGKETNAN